MVQQLDIYSTFHHGILEDGDYILIMGRCGEDGIIGRDIARRWKHVKVDELGSDQDCSEIEEKWESDEVPNFLLRCVNGPIHDVLE